MSTFTSQLRNSNRLANNKSTVLRPTIRYKDIKNFRKGCSMASFLPEMSVERENSK